ncbi:MAG TPA: M20/M25/M40 family metallo-hydrolase [Brevundimonas sp.]|uniref:M20/M25/M40 family metallo-hydrolase n=1 Tax=Brevundimonas sp. TaxID=1871086 RepID=UPI002C4E1C67|nr:M20/M25/M40 family metallo-hydrolase [Brevundimonas sp.]HRH20580.1 M20/M25/M40 family metallo-hydrolase [Brevundimonas sp.]
MRSLAGFLAALGLALLIALVTIRPPSPVSDEAPASDFSAERAMVDVRQIGHVVHPTGSPENDQVRETLHRRMLQLGLQVSTQTADGIYSRTAGAISGGRITNLVGVLPGEDPAAPAVMLMSHYDSAIGSPGAADDAAGVAASLEAVRVLLAQGAPRRRDLIVLITDGEEMGLLGAEAFFREHPLRTRVGVVVNLETRGAAGRAFMFETGRNNGAMMDLYARAVSEPSSTSLAAFLYSILPNDTDFSHPRDQGLPGFNIAFIGEPFFYHSANSTPDNLDQGSLQHMGSQALDLTRALLTANQLPPPRDNAIFSDVFGQFTVAYPAWVGWIIIALTGLVLAGLIIRSEPRGQTLRVAAIGAVAGLAMIGVCGLFGQGLLWLTGSPTDFIMNRPLLGRLDIFEIAMIAACVGGVFLVSAALLRGRPGLYRPHEAPALGLLALGWLLALTLQILAPEAAILAAWPTLFGVIALLAARRLGDLAWPIAFGVGVVGSAWAIGLTHGVFLGVGATMPAIPAALALVAILPLAPLLAAAVRGRLGAALGLAFLIAALAAGLWLRMAPAATPERPLPTLALYVVDSADGSARLASLPAMTDPWTNSLFDRAGGHPREVRIPGLGQTLWRTAPAPPVAFAPPQLSIISLPDGRVQISAADTSARDLRLTVVSSQPLADITVQGRSLDAPAPGTPLSLRWADPDPGFQLVLRAPAGAVLQWAAYHDGWPDDAQPLPRRSDDLAPFAASDSLVVTGEVPLTPPG